jgi:cobalt-precorrin 5A hydrolase
MTMHIDQTTKKRVALVVLTRAGLALALRLQEELATDVSIYASARAFPLYDARTDQAEGRLTQDEGKSLPNNIIIHFERVAPLLSQLWTTYDQIVLFFALGAVVRLIAPLLRHKHVDPAIVAIDDAGQFAISVVSGHSGDANGLARRCAEVLGATPVVTTASDVHSTLAVDLLAERQGWQVEDASAMTAVSAAIVNGEAVAILQDCEDVGWRKNENPWPSNLVHVSSCREVSARRFAALLVIADRLIEDLPQDVPTLVYRPPTLVLGIGCRRGVAFEMLDSFVRETLAEYGLALQSVALLATADIKADEVALQMLVQRYAWSFETHTVAILRTMTEVPSPSERVERLVGTPSVCEAAALLSSNGGRLVVPKQKGEGVTLAVVRKGRQGTKGGDYIKPGWQIEQSRGVM